MGHLTAPFIWFDSLVQRGVDSTVFFLMRNFGVRKSRIVYGVMAVIVVCATGYTAELFRERESVAAAVLALITFVFLLIMHSDLKDREKAENEGHMYSKADYMRKGSVFKILWWTLLVMDILETALGGMNFRLAMNLGWDASFVLLYYLAGTPNIPPAQEDTVLEPAENAA